MMHLVVLLFAILPACTGTTSKAGRTRVPEANQPRFQYNRQREAWERMVPRNTVEISQKKLAGMKDAPVTVQGYFDDINEMRKHFVGGGNLEVAHKHQRDGMTVFRADMHPNQLAEKTREVRNGISRRIDPHSAFELALGFHKERKDLFPPLYHAVIHSNPDHFSSYFNMASWLHAKGSVAEATQMFDVAHRLMPEHVLPQVSLTELYAQTGKLKLALLMLTKLSQRAELGIGRILKLRVMIATSILLQHQGLLTDAQTEYQKIVEDFKEQFDPVGSPDKHFASIVWLNMGTICHQLGQEQEAKKLWGKAVASMPSLAHFVPNTQTTNGMQPIYGQPMWPLWDDVLVDAKGKMVDLKSYPKSLH